MKIGGQGFLWITLLIIPHALVLDVLMVTLALVAATSQAHQMQTWLMVAVVEAE